MAVINKVNNTANVVYDGKIMNSNTVSTLLLLAPLVTMAVDKLTANIGEFLSYTITITNVSLSTYTNILFTDVIANGATYVVDSFKVNGAAATPLVNGQTLSYTIANIAALGVVSIHFQSKVIGGED